ncbi:MAG: hypothetical protein KGL39_29640 [Patescibacteria group bacterium]|nr:hypothetical protein [Patescibacteria group bacterium]
MSDPDDIDYSRAPVTIGELRAERMDSSSAITPRETLIQCLRLIDSGEWKPKLLIVMTADYPDDGRIIPHYRVSSPDPLLTIGLMSNVLQRYNDGSYDT